MDIISTLTERNDHAYNILKAVEELNELSTVLMQQYNKPGKVPTSAVIEELGDVAIRLQILERIYGQEAIDTRIKEKLSKYEGYIEENKFKNI